MRNSGGSAVAFARVADKTLFLIRKNNLGFSVPDGCIAIAESNSYDGKDHNLVIARQKGHLLARRLFLFRACVPGQPFSSPVQQ
jgi:hypothetical protein